MARASGRKPARSGFGGWLPHPLRSEKNSAANVTEMTEEKLCSAGLEAVESGLGHLQKSGTREGTFFAERAPRRAGAFSVQQLHEE